MPSRPWDNPPACSNCGSTRVAWVVQGMPNFGNPERRRLLEEGRILLGGCCFGNCWVCHDCAERERGPLGDQDRLDRICGPSGWNVYAGRFDPKESDAAREARERARWAKWKEQRAREMAHRATPIGAWEHLRSIIDAAGEDVRKTENGNKSAAARVRRQMQAARCAAQEVRCAILTVRDQSAKQNGELQHGERGAQ